jgi:FMN phosphatase YigB (HAD superfamily)
LCIGIPEQNLNLRNNVTVSVQAVLFDFSDTLFWRDGVSRIVALAAERGIEIAPGVAATLWAEIKAKSNSPEEIAKHRDSSAVAHAQCWKDLYRPLNQFLDGFDEVLYADQPNPIGWSPFPDTVEVMRTLHSMGVPMAVVSDIGWDVRPIFAHHGVVDCVGAWVLSFAHGIEKPDPKMFLMACDELGATPVNSLMVGDNLLKDGGAVHAGLRAFVLPTWTGIGERGLRPILGMTS